MAGRILDDWMATYMEWTAGTESPETFHRWTGMGVLGAAMGQNWIQGDVNFDLANNIFFILFAKQGKSRKSSAIEYGLKMLREIPEVTVSPGSISKEDMHRQMTECKNDLGESNYIVYAKELSSIIKTSGVDTPNYLIALYDEMDQFKNSTIGRGEELIVKPHVSFMSATTPNFIKNGFGGLDMRENGLMSRTCFIYAEGPRNPSAYGSRPDKETRQKLIHDLKHIAAERHRTKLYFDKEAYASYDQFYDSESVSTGLNPVEDAFISRKELHVLKVACILTISKRPRDGDDTTGLVITMDELGRAYEIIKKVQDDLVNINALLGTDPHLHVKIGVQDIMQVRKKMQLSTLKRRFFSEIDGAGINGILAQMVESEQIRIDKTADETWVYWVTD